MFKNKSLMYSYEKNELLKNERNIGFEDVILSLENGDLLDDISHPNKEKYPNQDIFILLSHLQIQSLKVANISYSHFLV